MLRSQSRSEEQVRQDRRQIASDWAAARQLRALVSESNNKRTDFSLKEWLTMLDLGQYYDAFVSHGFADRDKCLLPLVTDEELIIVGVSLIGHRKRFLAHAQALLFAQQTPTG